MVTVIAQSSSLLTDSSFNQRRGSNTKDKASEIRSPIPVPEALRTDPAFTSQIVGFAGTHANLSEEILVLRQKFNQASVADKGTLSQTIQKRSSERLHLEQQFKLAMRKRMRYLRSLKTTG